MYQKMKLTELRQQETSKEEMNLLKGGESPVVLCALACSCYAVCNGGTDIYQQMQQQTLETVSSSNVSALASNFIRR